MKKLWLLGLLLLMIVGCSKELTYDELCEESFLVIDSNCKGKQSLFEDDEVYCKCKLPKDYPDSDIEHHFTLKKLQDD